MAQLQNRPDQCIPVQNQNLIDSKSLITTTKGWDLRIFRDEHLAQRFLCGLCRNVCRDAHEMSCSNAHLFCEQCINEYSNNEQTTTCPICHEMNVSHQASRFVTRHINELFVFCPRSKLVCSKLMRNARFNNNTLFCNFQGTLQNLVEHTNSQCIFNVISCPFHLIGCPTNKMYRYELQKHINAAQNKHISLSLQKIQKLQYSLKQKEDSNEIYQEQLKALKIASRTKDQNLEKISMENEGLKMNANKMMNDVHRMREELKNANSRIASYSKAVNMLKDNNQKLAQQVDELNENNRARQQQQAMNEQYSAYSHGNNMHTMNGNINDNQIQSELSNQFQSLSMMQKQHSMGNSSVASDNGSAIKGVNNNDDKQANSTDVVCAFLKDHPEIVGKLKNSNQIMYANIITDDKYASQFLKKMLQSGNEEYKNEISNIVQRLQ